MNVRGSCLCRSVRVEAQIQPDDWMEYCHCSMCRKAAGAAFGTWIDLPAARVELDGPVRWFASSAEWRRGFCPECGGSVAGRHEGSDVISIAAGCLDDDPGIRPQAHIYVASRAPWAPLEPGLPCYDRNRPK